MQKEEQKNQKILLMCLEIASLTILLPIFYLGTIKLLIVPIDDNFYPNDIYEHRSIPTWMAFLAVLALDVIWIVLMRFCPKDRFQVKLILTLLVLTVSAAVLSCFIILEVFE